MTLPTNYRPENLDEFQGNKALIRSLRSVLDRDDDIPPAFLFSGPSGCGKSTLARIIKNMLNITNINYHFYNASNTRGIDTIRDIIDNAPYFGIAGGKKLYVFEECFAKGTMVSTLNEQMPIENIKPGDKVRNVYGEDVVEKVFVNKIPLSRIVLVKTTNGKEIICSEDHEFLTEKGWVRARYLDRSHSLCYGSESMTTIHSQGVNHEELQRMSKRVQIGHENETILFQQLLSCSFYETFQRTRFNLSDMWGKIQKQSNKFKILSDLQIKTNDLRVLWKRIYGNFIGNTIKRNSFLFPELCWEMEKLPRRLEEVLYNRTEQECFQKLEEIFSNTSRETGRQRMFKADEKKQPFIQSRKHSKSQRSQKDQRFFACLERDEGRERSTDCPTNDFSFFSWMENGGGHSFGEKTTRIPHKLQSGHRKSRFESGDRSRWEFPSWEKGFISRQKKRSKTERVRVESVAFYKSTCDVQPFDGVVGHRERSQGFAEFYDLQVKNHPSYIAGNCVVHNCHQITGPAQEGLLDLLEHPPEHTHFVFCTTEPQKLKITLRRRCFQGSVEPLSSVSLINLLVKTLETEEVSLSSKIMDKIVECSDGSPGIALGMLDSVIDMEEEDEEDAIEAITLGVPDIKIIELCRSLMKDPSKWSEVQAVLKSIDLKKVEAESVRMMIVGYFTSVMLKNPNQRIANIGLLFTDSFIYSRGLGLAIACWEACKNQGR